MTSANKMSPLLACVLLRITFILCLSEDEEHLVRMVTEKYKFDYQVLVVDEGTKLTNFVRNQAKFSQVVTTANFVDVFKTSSELGNLGFFVFLENNEDRTNFLRKIDPSMFVAYTWFINTDNIRDTDGLELRFDTDIHYIDSTGDSTIDSTGVGGDIYEVFAVKDRVVTRMVGSYSDGRLDIETTNIMERRTDLHGLTLR